MGIGYGLFWCFVEFGSECFLFNGFDGMLFFRFLIFLRWKCAVL